LTTRQNEVNKVASILSRSLEDFSSQRSNSEVKFEIEELFGGLKAITVSYGVELYRVLLINKERK